MSKLFTLILSGAVTGGLFAILASGLVLTYQVSGVFNFAYGSIAFVGDIQSELDIPNSTLSHHLEKLKNEDLVNVRRESTFLRYTANTEALQELLQFLYAECCTRNKAVKPQTIVQLCK